jgi:outer membrane lipoprotein SlyB
MKQLFVYLMLVFTLLATGCVPSKLTGESYSRDDARSPQQVRYATVVDLRPVQIEGTKSGIGGAAGAAVGGVAGSATGDGKGATIATILGAVAGGIVGAKAEEGVTRAQGVEVTVRYEDNGQIVAIVQEDDPNVRLNIGERVRVLTLNGVTRVAR